MSAPLADRLRPQKIDDMVGQHHLLGNDKALRKIIEVRKSNPEYIKPLSIMLDQLVSAVANFYPRSP